MENAQLGKTIMGIGAGLLLVGALVWIAPKVPFLSWFGRLPGDLRFQQGDSVIVIPVTTMLLLSILISAAAALFNGWRR